MASSRFPPEWPACYFDKALRMFFIICADGFQLAGKNAHHIVESTFKAFARALRQACSPDPRRQGAVASSKGVLTQS